MLHVRELLNPSVYPTLSLALALTLHEAVALEVAVGPSVKLYAGADGHSTADKQRLQAAPGPSPSAMGIADEPMTGESDGAAEAAGAGQPSQAASVDVRMADAEPTAAAPESRSRAAQQAKQEQGGGV